MKTLKRNLTAILLAVSAGALLQPTVAQVDNPVDQYGDPLPSGASARMGTLRWRHGGPVYFVGFTNEGKQLVTASSDGHFRVWDNVTGKELRRFGKLTAQAAGQGGIVINGNAVMAYPINMIRGVDITADGKTLAVASQDGSIQIFDVGQGKDLHTLRNSRGAVMGLCFSPDGKTLVAKGTDQQLSRWEVASGKELPRFGSPPDAKRRIYFGGGAGNTIAFSADGKRIASAAMEIDNNRAVGLVQIFDAETGKEIRAIKGTQNAYAQSLVFAGDLLAWAGTDGTIRLYDTNTGQETRTIGQLLQGRYYSTLIVSPDGKTLAGRLINSSGIQLWDVDTGKELKTLGEEQQAGIRVFIRTSVQGNANSIAFAPDGKTLAEGLPSNTVRLWNLADAKEILPAVGHQGGVSNLGVSADGKTIVTRGTDNSIRTWDIATGKERQAFKLPAGSGNADLSADGKLLVFGGLNNTVHVWDVATGKELRNVPIQAAQNFGNVAAGVGGLVLSQDGKIVAVRGYDQFIYLVETATGRILPPLADAQPNNQNGIVIINGMVARNGASSFTFSPDGTLLATVGTTQQVMIQPNAPARQQQPRGVIQLYSTASGRLVRRFESQQRLVTDLVFSPDGQTLATANLDQSVSIWEVITGKELFNFKAGQPQPQQQNPQMQTYYQTGSSTALAFSPDGRLLALGGGDNIIRVYDVYDGKELAKFAGHEGAILCLAFTPNGRMILSGSNDTTALAWDGSTMLALAAKPVVELSAQEVQALWNDLAEPAKVHKAKSVLRAAPQQAVPLFKAQIKPEVGVPAEQIDAMIKDLESDDFNVRQKATEDLEKLGPLAKPALEKVRDGQSSLETRQRVEKLLNRLESNAEPPPDQLRAIRAISILEGLGTDEARVVLDTLAKGAPGARLTVAAQEATERLSQRGK